MTEIRDEQVIELKTINVYYQENYELAQVLTISSDEVLKYSNYTDVLCVLPYKMGFARIFDPSELMWSYIEDNRGFNMYKHDSRDEVVVDYLGAVKPGYTLETPISETCYWDNGWTEPVV